MNIVSKEEFEKKTNTNYSYNTSAEAYETNQKFSCGCGEDHLIGKDGVKVIKQVNNFEFVVNKVKITKGAAEDGSPGILRLKPNRFFCPLNEIK